METQRFDKQTATDALARQRRRLLAHPIYHALRTPADLQRFMAHHVFAVWDFMSLLKRLQRELTCVDLPWRPPTAPQFARFVQEIALEEECDADGRGGYASHFELYLQAMREVGADTAPAERLVDLLQQGIAPETALRRAQPPEAVLDFTGHTLSLAMRSEPHEVAAAFFFGREELIPDMFRQVVAGLEARGNPPARLLYYLQRHIELDEADHGPLAWQLLEHLCADDLRRWQQATAAASESLRHRHALWDAALAAIERG